MKFQKLLSFSLFFIIAVAVSILSCKKTQQESTNPTPVVTETSSFDLIQSKILTPSCAVSGCHLSTNDATYKQHGLVLEKSVAYANLVGVVPLNAAGKSDGLLRVKAFQSLESLLYQKLFSQESHHVGKNYGSLMPLGGTPLTVGQIEFVRRWIEAGAQKTGSQVDVTLLDDKTPSNSDVFTPLEAPKVGEGYQVKVDLFTINPNFEREIFVHRKLNNPTEVYINRLTMRSRPNSHHMVVYDFRDRSSLPAFDLVRDLRNDDNTLNLGTFLTMQNHLFIAGGTLSNQEYIFPEGTALKIPANYSFDLNPHYFNKTNSILYGENYVNFYTTDKANVKNIVQMFDLANQNISIAPNERKTLTKSWTFAEARTVVMLTSHTHKLGEKFVIKIKGGARDGEVLYENTDWEHPLVKNFSPMVQLNKGEGLSSEITYFNNTTKTVTFGLTSDDEMGIIFGYYY